MQLSAMPEEIRRLTEDEFWDLYYPIDASPEEVMWEYEETKQYPITQVWTIVPSEDNSEIEIALPGYHIVNRVGYIVTRKPWTTTLIEGVWYQP